MLIKGVLPDISLMIFGQLVPTNTSSDLPDSALVLPVVSGSRNIVPALGSVFANLPAWMIRLHLPLTPCASQQPLALSGMLSRTSGVAKWPWPWATNAPWSRGDGIRKGTQLRRERGLVSSHSCSRPMNCIIIKYLQNRAQALYPWMSPLVI